MTDLVALDLPAGPEFVAALHEAWERDQAVLPLPRQAPARYRRDTARRLGARWLLDEAGRHELPSERPLEPGDALVMLSSGTTGEPKGAVITHRAVEWASFATAVAAGIDSATHWVACLPLSHVGGLSVITRARLSGAGLTVLERFDAELLDDALARGATHTSLVPTALRRIDPAGWRRILLGGSAIPADLPPNCTATYGMTETFGGVVYDGLPLNGVEVRTVGPGAPDGFARIQLRSPTLLRCYRGSRGSADLDPLDSDGWFTTGDLGRISPTDGHLHISGRADDLINTGGEKVWPAEVEARLIAHPGVADAAVVGRPDPEWGEVVTAVVVPEDATAAPTLPELRAWVREELPVAAAPHALELRDSLPRTALGKVARSRLDDPGSPGS